MDATTQRKVFFILSFFVVVFLFPHRGESGATGQEAIDALDKALAATPRDNIHMAPQGGRFPEITAKKIVLVNRRVIFESSKVCRKSLAALEEWVKKKHPSNGAIEKRQKELREQMYSAMNKHIEAYAKQQNYEAVLDKAYCKSEAFGWPCIVEAQDESVFQQLNSLPDVSKEIIELMDNV
ncbi:OmpH family outer membrane protein [Solidesulfovibrio magneticus]|uniref:Uncharacterized protein n=1 Tax=Solidesulfovibrio magneticus (strain ATCC 700980 / DSM 13731 / RS-1) TaxID=573370 RepID=C4XQH3_SOLM1|nr:OmpH family outer membrane protein [Solidesulfovibrio magneticus]BAH75338.1 hypothetical protein DMR_18470 [Solidesulfovibrio magneticus RS-1]